MALWKRLAVTVVAILVASFVAGRIWVELLGFPLPSYAAGAIGGLAAIPVWEFLGRIRPKKR